jgi:hypothetical protein
LAGVVVRRPRQCRQSSALAGSAWPAAIGRGPGPHGAPDRLTGLHMGAAVGQCSWCSVGWCARRHTLYRVPAGVTALIRSGSPYWRPAGWGARIGVECCHRADRYGYRVAAVPDRQTAEDQRTEVVQAVPAGRRARSSRRGHRGGVAFGVLADGDRRTPSGRWDLCGMASWAVNDELEAFAAAANR